MGEPSFWGNLLQKKNRKKKPHPLRFPNFQSTPLVVTIIRVEFYMWPKHLYHMVLLIISFNNNPVTIFVPTHHVKKKFFKMHLRVGGALEQTFQYQWTIILFSLTKTTNQNSELSCWRKANTKRLRLPRLEYFKNFIRFLFSKYQLKHIYSKYKNNFD